MKKAILLGLVALCLAACGSFRSNNETYYATLFGISVESFVFGDGIVVGKFGQFNSPVK